MPSDLNRIRDRATTVVCFVAPGSIALMLPAWYRVATSRSAGTDLAMDRDDADAVVAAFGVPEEDRPVESAFGDPLAGTRVMAYRSRGVLVFLRRRIAAPTRFVWKMVRPTDVEGKRSLSGEEAFQRLKAR